MSADPYINALSAVNVKVKVGADLGYYQGDYVALVSRGAYFEDAWGFLVIGYGSCSGCDSWEAEENDPAALAEIIAGLAKSIRWFDTIDEAKAYILDGEQTALQWYGNEDGWTEFTDQVRRSQP